MDRLVLKIRRGTQTIGTWNLDGQPIEMLIEDSGTGKVLGRFTASGAEPSEELPLPSACRTEGDDLTMPLPELTNSVPLTLPDPDPDSGSGVNHTHQFIVQAEERRLQAVRILNQSDDISLSAANLVDAVTDGDDATEWTDILSEHHYRRVSSNTGNALPAEVWLRRTGEWHARKALHPGFRVEAAGGWIELESSGRLVVDPGRKLIGTVNCTDGRSYDLVPGTGPTTLNLGASVILRDGDVGLYVRGRVTNVSRTDQPTEESPR